MIFESNLPTDKPIDGYNNSIIEFSPTETEKGIINCIVTIADFSYELTPNNNREFKFNFIDIVRVLINQTHFNNTITPDLNSNFVYEDSTLFLELTVSFTFNFDDETTETDSQTYKFLKSVSQHYGLKHDNDSRLFPLLDQYNKQFEVSYFEGFPFDIAFYSDVDRQVAIKNKKTDLSKTYDVKKGVNRLFISDGPNTITNTNELPLLLGYNYLEFYIGAELIYSVNVIKHDVQQGNYFRWFNLWGSYSYYLINTNYNLTTSARAIARLKTSEKNLNQSSGTETITGKAAGQTKRLLSQLLTRNDYSTLSTITLSPKVQLLNKERLMQVNEVDWLDVRVADGAITSKPNLTKQRIPLTVELPAIYTQTL